MLSYWAMDHLPSTAGPRIIVIGHAALDSVYRIQRFPPSPTKVRALEHLECGGGSAANAAAAIAHLGGNVELWSRTGADETGKRIIEGLRKDRVPTDYVRVHAGSRSSHAAVIVDENGERLIVSERDHAMPSSPEGLPLEHIASSAAVLSDLRWFEATQAAFAEAKRVDVPCLLDIDVGGGGFVERFLPLTDYAIFSAPGLTAFAGEGSHIDLLGKVIAAGVRHAGVTLGAGGYLWRTRSGEQGFQPAYSVQPVIDTTGAGDVFHGAFAWALAHGCKDAQCARVAAAAAALSVRRLGARAALPNREDLSALLGDG